jgi:GxxExxY protein
MTEELIYRNETYNIIGAAMSVHRELGSGFLESVYQEALEIEFSRRNIPYIAQQKIQIQYKDVLLKQYYIPDFFCYDKIIVEIKAASAILPEHEAQIIHYVKATGKKMGLLLNFGEESLYHKRFPNLSSKPIRTNPQL